MAFVPGRRVGGGAGGGVATAAVRIGRFHALRHDGGGRTFDDQRVVSQEHTGAVVAFEGRSSRLSGGSDSGNGKRRDHKRGSPDRG